MEEVDWAKKYGARKSFKGQKSGFTAVALEYPTGQPDLEKRATDQKRERFQREQLHGFTTQQLIDFDAISFRNLKPCNLGDESFHSWAKRIDPNRIPPRQPPKDAEKSWSIHYNHTGSYIIHNSQAEFFHLLGSYLRIGFKISTEDAFTREKYKEESADAFTIPTMYKSGTISIIWILLENGIVQPLFDQDLSDSEKFGIHFYIANTIVHECMHAFWHISHILKFGEKAKLIPPSPTEVYVENDPLMELGTAMETRVFGGFIQRMNRDLPFPSMGYSAFSKMFINNHFGKSWLTDMTRKFCKCALSELGQTWKLFKDEGDDPLASKAQKIRQQTNLTPLERKAAEYFESVFRTREAIQNYWNRDRTHREEAKRLIEMLGDLEDMITARFESLHISAVLRPELGSALQIVCSEVLALLKATIQKHYNAATVFRNECSTIITDEAKYAKEVRELFHHNRNLREPQRRILHNLDNLRVLVANVVSFEDDLDQIPYVLESIRMIIYKPGEAANADTLDYQELSVLGLISQLLSVYPQDTSTIDNLIMSINNSDKSLFAEMVLTGVRSVRSAIEKNPPPNVEQFIDLLKNIQRAGFSLVQMRDNCPDRWKLTLTYWMDWSERMAIELIQLVNKLGSLPQQQFSQQHQQFGP
ncbi:hypothetical protein G7Y89_g1649 [Cudoniella acicularis]|uniref:Uncharacterized protein n=1 Tax=Cudoniella acicularis TaxID=354080 RepID=A0A8H4RVN4_9HELO|nr:hypothetical protein G7Y89_g1649 [Cudoniella acicularis]